MTTYAATDNMTNVTEVEVIRPDWAGRFLVVAFLFWISFVTYVAQLNAWFGIGFSSGGEPGWRWVSASLIQVGLTAVPLIPFALWWRRSRYRAVFQTWLAAALVPLLLAPTRFFYPTQSQLALFSQSILLLLLAAVLWAGYRRRLSGNFRLPRTALALAAALAFLISLPFFWWGSLGSLLDILLTLALGLLFSVVVGLVIGGHWLYELRHTSQGLGWDMLTGGLVVGAALLIMGSGLSFNGVQIILMLVLPALGWGGMAVAVTGRPPRQAVENRLALGSLAGLVAALMLLFTDSDGIFLGAMDGILRWSFQAAFFSLWAALLAGFLLLLLRKRLVAVGNGRSLTIFALFTVAFSIGLYLWLGQPGLYGDGLFVILKDQADVSAAAEMEDYDARRQFVYHTLTGHATTTQADLRASLDRLGVAYRPYYLVNALEVRGGLLHRLWLSSRPEVAHVIPSPVMRPVPADLILPTAPSSGPAAPDWNLTNIGADRVWAEFGVTGDGIVVGQSDSGADLNHPELRDGYRGRDGSTDNWFDPWQGTPSPVDANGHGTHTLATVLGNSVGVAPDATWFACANLSRNLGNPALYLDCMQFMLAPFPQNGDPFVDGDPLRSAHVLNNSWGCPEEYEGCDPDSLRTAVRALRDAGIFIVASAGNEGPECETVAAPIAIYDEVFSVGAVDSNNNIAVFSSAGPVTVDGSGRIKPDIAAPGVDVLSALPGGSYGRNSGTSMAGPHVAGVVALMWSANPALIGDIERTEEILRASAAPFMPHTAAPNLPADLADMAGDLPLMLTETLDQTANLTQGTCLSQTDTSIVPNNIAGYGIVDAYEAVKMALEG